MLEALETVEKPTQDKLGQATVNLTNAPRFRQWSGFFWIYYCVVFIVNT